MNDLDDLTLKDFLEAGLTKQDFADHRASLEWKSKPQDDVGYALMRAERSARRFGESFDRACDITDLAKRGAEIARAIGKPDKSLELIASARNLEQR
jgi:hypothetical protein